MNARDEFLSIAGHELRTPLTTLRMCLFGLARFGGPDVSAAVRQVGRLERLVEQLLEILLRALLSSAIADPASCELAIDGETDPRVQ